MTLPSKPSDLNKQRAVANGVEARAEDRARSHRWLRVLDSRYAGIAILIVGALSTVLATVLTMQEEEHEEAVLMQSDTAPFRNAVEREIGKYASLQAVAQLTSDTLANASGDGVRTYLLGETLQRLYPAVSFVAFVRVVEKADLDAYARGSRVTPGFDESGLPASVKLPKQARSRHYFLENATPSRAAPSSVGTDLGEDPLFARALERAAHLGSLLFVPEDKDSSRSLPRALVIASVARPMPQPVGSSRSAAPATREPPIQQPYGYLVSGIDFNRLMTDALRDLPPGWRVRLTALSVTESAAESGVKGSASGAAGAAEYGILLFDSNAASTGKTAGTASSEVPIRMRPFEFEAWRTRLRLDIDGYENHQYLLLHLMPWMAFFVCVLLTAGLHLAFTRYRDVTQQRQFRERLSQLHQDQARHLQANLAGQLLSGLAHELNQPLSAISTYNQACLRLLQSGNADPKEMAAAMQATADLAMHAGAILRRLRGFTSRREPHMVPTDLASLVGNSCGLIEIRLKSFAIELRIEIPEALPAVQVDPVLATQVFLNLFNNAIDAMRDAALRRLTVRAKVVPGGNVRIRVEDSGAGIAPEHMARLFDAYFTTKPEGTGIGLTLCRSIVEAMGGSIEIHSTPDEGAVVELEFPVARAEERNSDQPSDVSAGPA